MHFFPPRTLELTLALFKPHLVKFPHCVQEIRESLLINGFFFIRSKRCVMTPEESRQFYKEHEGKQFYKKLVTMMSSGPIDCYILARREAVKKWRAMMGPTKSFTAQFTNPSSIRGIYGLSDTRNATHGSGSHLSALEEIGVIFPDFSITKWYSIEEEHFRNGYVVFDEENLVHRISPSTPFQTSNS